MLAGLEYGRLIALKGVMYQKFLVFVERFNLYIVRGVCYAIMIYFGDHVPERFI